MKRLYDFEPVYFLAAVNSILALAVGFGSDVTPEQVGLINAAVAAVLAFLVRRKVTPVAE